jgi:feruloyl esterase
MRLFYAPGMGHCGNGDGPNVFDALTPLEQWREQGKAPSSITAAHGAAPSPGGVQVTAPKGDKIDRTRPLCAYPMIAHYKGTGSVNDAQNFICEVGAPNGQNASK